MKYLCFHPAVRGSPPCQCQRNTDRGRLGFRNQISFGCAVPGRSKDSTGHGQSAPPHKPASLYKAFPSEEARRILRRLEIHYTPKHGSWLDMAEIELNVMTRQCLSRRVEDIESLRKELGEWETWRNGSVTGITWQFTTADARTKLSSLYPKFDMKE